MHSAPRRILIVLAIGAGWTLLCGGLWQRGLVPLQQAENFTQDWQARLGRKTSPDDRLVLIGIDKPVYAADFSFHDVQDTPFTVPTPMGGPEIHLQLLNAALHGEFLRESTGAARLGFSALAGWLAALLSFGIRQPARRLFAVVVVAIEYVVVAQLL